MKEYFEKVAPVMVHNDTYIFPGTSTTKFVSLYKYKHCNLFSDYMQQKALKYNRNSTSTCKI